MGARLGIAVDRRADLRRAALLHDIGKLGSPIDTRQAGPLSPTSAAVREHPLDTEEILAGSAVPPVAATRRPPRADGRGGYTAACTERSWRAARALAVADVFEALTASRPVPRGDAGRRSPCDDRPGAGPEAVPRRHRGARRGGERGRGADQRVTRKAAATGPTRLPSASSAVTARRQDPGASGDPANTAASVNVTNVPAAWRAP